jgi:hypothetical protein
VEGVLTVDGQGAAASDSLADGRNALWSGRDEEDDLNKSY